MDTFSCPYLLRKYRVFCVGTVILILLYYLLLLTSWQGSSQTRYDLFAPFVSDTQPSLRIPMMGWRLPREMWSIRSRTILSKATAVPPCRSGSPLFSAYSCPNNVSADLEPSNADRSAYHELLELEAHRGCHLAERDRASLPTFSVPVAHAHLYSMPGKLRELAYKTLGRRRGS